MTGLAADYDFDGDGVPNSLDNAPETANGDVEDPAYQVDTDLDMCGNICDGDLNNDGTVGGQDYNAFKAAWGSSGSGLNADFNSDNGVGGLDYNIFKNKWNTTAPWY